MNDSMAQIEDGQFTAREWKWQMILRTIVFLGGVGTGLLIAVSVLR